MPTTKIQPPQTRVQNEKKGHNEITIENDKRTNQHKYYNIIIPINQKLDNLIYSNIHDQHVFLDYGCGGGDYLITRHNYFNNGIGIDISETLIEFANHNTKKNNIKNLNFYVMDATKTTFNNEQFDTIRGSGILHHLDIEPSLLEIKRILKNNGTAYFIEPLNTNPLIRIYRKLTPNARTIDEQPLRIHDITLIKKIFPSTIISYHSFLSILAVPFHNTRIFSKLLSFFSAIDNFLLNKIGPLKGLSGICILQLKK